MVSLDTACPRKSPDHKVRPEEASVKRALLRYSGLKYVGQALAFVRSFVLAAILGPAAFGVLGMAWVCVSLASIATRLGFISAIVSRTEVDGAYLNTAFWVALGSRLLTAVAVLLTAPFAAHIYGSPEVTGVLAALAPLPLIPAIAFVPDALLRRQMAFHVLGQADVVGIISSLGCALAGATFMHGPWVLVVAAYAERVARAAYVWLMQPWLPSGPPSVQYIRELLKFGSGVLGSSLAGVLHRQGDNAVVGMLLGAPALGVYTFCYRFVLLPQQALSQLLQSVLLPRMATASNQALVTYAYKGAGAVFVVAAAVMGLIGNLAWWAQPLLLGVEWSPVRTLLPAFVAAGILQAGVKPLLNILFVARRTDILAFLSFGTTGLVLGALTVGALVWGLPGMSVGYLVATILTCAATLHVCARAAGPCGNYLWRGLRHHIVVSSVAMASAAAVGFLFLPFAAPNADPTLPWGIALLVGWIVWGLLTLATKPAGYEEVLSATTDLLQQPVVVALLRRLRGVTGLGPTARDANAPSPSRQAAGYQVVPSDAAAQHPLGQRPSDKGAKPRDP